MARKTQRAAKSPATEMSLKVVLESSEDVSAYYVNFAEVTHTLYDFTMSLARVPSKFSNVAMEAAKETGTLTVTPMLQVVLPPTVVPSLIRALQARLDAYVNQFGALPAESKNE